MPADRFLHPKAGHSDKVTRLSHFEYRVWTQYMLSADDFGVMRATAVKLQADNDALAHAKASIVQAAIEKVIACGLIRVFEHQGRRYVFQHDWQKWQRVEWPRLTNEPKPPEDALAVCDDVTQALFAKHPGGQRRLRGGSSSGGDVQASTPVHAPVHDPGGSGDVQDARPVRTPTTRAGTRAERLRLTANGSGSRQPAEANGSRLEGGAGETTPALDLWFRELCGLYPPERVTVGFMSQSAFHEIITTDGRPPEVVFAVMKANLESQKHGDQWADRKFIPKLEKWLRSGDWSQVHQAPSLVSERTRQNAAGLEAAKRMVEEGRFGTH